MAQEQRLGTSLCVSVQSDLSSPVGKLFFVISVLFCFDFIDSLLMPFNSFHCLLYSILIAEVYFFCCGC